MADRVTLPLATEESFHSSFTGRHGDRSRYRHEVLSFMLGTEEYGIDILRIREILKLRPVTEVPRAPGFVPGIISVRGEVVPVIDLRLRLRLPPAPFTKDSRILVVTREDEAAGLIVDSVRQVIRMRDEDVEPPPAAFAVAESEYIGGIGRPWGERILILLNLDAVLHFRAGNQR